MGDLFSKKTKTKSTSTNTGESTSKQTANTTSSQTSDNVGVNYQTNDTSGTSVQGTDTGPSLFQLPFLQQLFGGASDDYSKSQTTPFYTGDLFAGMSDDAKTDLATSKDYATTTGLGTAKTLSGLGSSLTGSFGLAQDMLKKYLALANEDPTESIVAAAQKYANDPSINAQVDGVSRDVNRQLSEEVLPGIDRQASRTGNINSSRAGIAAGVAQRGAGDRIADMSAQIRGQAYQRGLDLATNARTSKLGARKDAIGTYAGFGSQGVSALGAGTSAGYSALDLINGLNKTEQTDRQGQNDADYAAWTGNDTRSSELLKRFAAIVGSNQRGTSGTSYGATTGNTTRAGIGTSSGSSTGSGSSSSTASGTNSGTSSGTSTVTSNPGLGNIVAGGLTGFAAFNKKAK